jgi:hypothetical protein
MSDPMTPSELPSANELGDVVDALEREIAAFRRLRDGLTAGSAEKPTDESAPATAAG